MVVFAHSNIAFDCFRPFDSKNPFLAPVTINRRLNKGGDRHLMHLELDITGSKIRSGWFSRTCRKCFVAQGQGHGLGCIFRYESGDHVAVFPTNDSALVNKLGQVLGVDLDVVISLNNLDGTALNTQKDLELAFTYPWLQDHVIYPWQLHAIISVYLSISHVYHAKILKRRRRVINFFNCVLVIVY